MINYSENKFKTDFSRFFVCDFTDCTERAMAEVYLYLRNDESVRFNVCPHHGKLIGEKIQRKSEYEIIP